MTNETQTQLSSIPVRVVAQLQFAVDADRTFTRSDRSVSDATAAAVQAVYAAGGAVHLCTGRSYSTLKAYLLSFFPDDALHVVAGGAQIITTQGKRVWGRELPGQLLAELVAKAEELGCGYAFGVDEVTYASGDVRSRLGLIFGDKLKTGGLNTLPGELSSLRVPLLFIGGLNDAMVEYLQSRASEIHFKEMADYEGHRYVDVTATGVTKATGLNELARQLALPVNEIITVGDERNDTEMIQAGWGVAMGNAIDEIKAKANITIGHTDQDGLAEFMQKLAAIKQQREK